MVERVEVINHRLFGEQVKAWAKGAERIPKDLEEFADQLARAGVGLKLPDTIKSVKFVQDDPETLIVRLPCRSRLIEAEGHLVGRGGTYPMPAFYEQTFGGRPKVGDQLSFQAARIGDYSIAQCF